MLRPVATRRDLEHDLACTRARIAELRGTNDPMLKAMLVELVEREQRILKYLRRAS